MRGPPLFATATFAREPTAAPPSAPARATSFALDFSPTKKTRRRERCREKRREKATCDDAFGVVGKPADAVFKKSRYAWGFGRRRGSFSDGFSRWALVRRRRDISRAFMNRNPGRLRHAPRVIGVLEHRGDALGERLHGADAQDLRQRPHGGVDLGAELVQAEPRRRRVGLVRRVRLGDARRVILATLRHCRVSA